MQRLLKMQNIVHIMYVKNLKSFLIFMVITYVSLKVTHI